MTTIVANLACMASDRLVSYGPSYNGDKKIWIAQGAIWGAAGAADMCIAFKKWTLHKGPKPSPDSDEDKIEVLQLSPKGLFLWVSCGGPDAVKEAQASIERLKAAKDALDVAIVERDKRAKELETAKRKVAHELSELKKTLATEDQACLDRDLPPAILERLRQ